jgi:hypothetical protein
MLSDKHQRILRRRLGYLVAKLGEYFDDTPTAMRAKKMFEDEAEALEEVLAVPAVYYFGLLQHSSDLEVEGGGYARVAASESASPQEVALPRATGSWNKGDGIDDFGLYDKPTGGRLLYRGHLDQSVRINTGDARRVLVGPIRLST